MIKFYSVVLLVCAALLCCSTVMGADPGMQLPGVKELDAESFDTVVNAESGTKYVFVEFYATWCGQCKNFIKEFSHLGAAYEKADQSIRDKLVLAKVDAVQNEEIALRYHVKGFPTLLLFSPGDPEPQMFRGHRDAHLLSDFLKESIPGFPMLVSEARNDALAYVTTLTDRNFDSVALDGSKDVLVLFYATWCMHCKSFKPTYSAVAELFANDQEHVVIARIDASRKGSEGIAGRYQVRSFPTVYFFPKGEKENPILYTGARTVPAILSFLNRHIDRPRLLSGEVGWQYGVIPELSELAASFVFSKPDSRKERLEAFEEATKKYEGSFTVSIYKELMKKMSADDTEPYSVISNEAARLDQEIPGLPKSSARDTLTVSLNIVKSIDERE